MTLVSHRVQNASQGEKGDYAAGDTTPIFTANLGGMYPRALEPPRSSLFLFGPRGTGKGTWIRTHFEDALIVNLLPVSA